MHGLGKTLLALSVALSTWFAGAPRAEAQNLTVHGTTTSQGSAYLATTTGNVGIGTTSPEFRLQVIDTNGNQGTLALGAFGVGVVQNPIDSPYYDRLLVGEGLVWDHPNARYKLTNPGYDRSAIVFMNGGSIGFFTHSADRRSNPTMTRAELAGYQRMVVTNTGTVGIGTATPNASYRLHVAGSVYVNGTVTSSRWSQLSSRDYKQDVEHLDDAEYDRMRVELRKLDLARYRYRPEVSGGETGRRLGFIAEELPREVLGDDGKAVDLYELTTYAIGAMKALDAQAERLRAELAQQRSEIQALRDELARSR
jgi:hypothetical protein